MKRYAGKTSGGADWRVEMLGTPLTPREREVVELIHKGMTDKGVSQELGISDKTARNHVSNAFARIGITSRAELVLWIERGGLQANGLPEPEKPCDSLREAARALLTGLDEYIDYEQGSESEFGMLLPYVRRVRELIDG